MTESSTLFALLSTFHAIIHHELQCLADLSRSHYPTSLCPGAFKTFYIFVIFETEYLLHR